VLLLLPGAAGFAAAADLGELLALLLLAPAADCDSAAGLTNCLPGILLLLPVAADFESTASAANLAHLLLLLLLPHANLKGGPLLAVPLPLLLPLPKPAACEMAAGATDLLPALQLSQAEKAGVLAALLLPRVGASASAAADAEAHLLMVQQLLLAALPKETAAADTAKLLVALGLPASLPILTVASVSAAVCSDSAVVLWKPGGTAAHC
jgi:hypothetical protein